MGIWERSGHEEVETIIVGEILISYLYGVGGTLFDDLLQQYWF